MGLNKIFFSFYKSRYNYFPLRADTIRKKPHDLFKIASPAPHNLYISIPFCVNKCLYCKLPTIARLPLDQMTRYLDYLKKEMSLVNKIFADTRVRIHNIYIGGGTPSILDNSQIGELFTACRKYFNFDNMNEINFEIHPNYCDRKKLQALKDRGVNRLSFGIESFSEHILRKCNRAIDINKAIKLIGQAKKLNFFHINLDLMYGLPFQTFEDIHGSVETVIALKPSEITYNFLDDASLTKEMFRVQRNKYLPSAELKLRFYKYIAQKLRDEGYRQLGKNNFSRDNYFSAYQLARWNNADIIGMGLSAKSSLGNNRLHNTNILEEYYRLLDRGDLPLRMCFVPSQDDLLREYLFNNLRLQIIDTALYEKIFHIDFKRYFTRELACLRKKDLIRETGDRIFITSKGTACLEELQDILVYSNCPKNRFVNMAKYCLSYMMRDSRTIRN